MAWRRPKVGVSAVQEINKSAPNVELLPTVSSGRQFLKNPALQREQHLEKQQQQQQQPCYPHA
eukprot:7252614-Pyramimonas_sp.AAC.1